MPYFPFTYPPKRRRALILFVLTCLSTLYAGSTQFAMGRRVVDAKTNRTAVELDVGATIRNGLSYATGVISVDGVIKAGDIGSICIGSSDALTPSTTTPTGCSGGRCTQWSTC